MLMFREIRYGSEDYSASLRLRDLTLRAPLGKALSAADTDGEQEQRHFGCFSSDELIACVVVKPTTDPARVKLRQMAVADSCQGTGVGSRLLLEVEMLLKQQGVSRLELAARQVAEGFYKKLGYQPTGASFIEVGIVHIKMQKRI